MVDVVSVEVRSRMMAGIGPRNTLPEMALRRAIHARGFRFRLHTKNLCSASTILSVSDNHLGRL